MRIFALPQFGTAVSFKSNIFANYCGQAYVTLVGIVMVPILIRYMGAEAYGLVGFFAMMQAWFQLLDMGLTPTITRQAACFNGGAVQATALRGLLRAFEIIFGGIAVVSAAAIVLGADAIAGKWLKVDQLPLDEVRNAIMLMALIVAMRWISGIYRGAITGFERLVWLNGFNAAVATARFVLVIPFLVLVGASPTEFFLFQLVVALVELVTLTLKTYMLLPTVDAGTSASWQWRSLQGVLGFSLINAFTTSVWVVTTQIDRLVLSKLLPLADYAYFTLAVLAASGVMMISGPISAALIPRMARLSAEGKETEMIYLYRRATQLVAVIAIPSALVLALFAEQVIWVWTGDAAAAEKAAPVLTLYALGYGILALAAFPYYLQFAKGDLKLHLIGNALFVTILTPALIEATVKYGMLGAGYAWLGSNAIYFLIWAPKVHNRFYANLHAKWLLNDIGAIMGPALAGAMIAHWLVRWPQGRTLAAIWIAAVSLALLAVAAASSSHLRFAASARSNRWLARQR